MSKHELPKVDSHCNPLLSTGTKLHWISYSICWSWNMWANGLMEIRMNLHTHTNTQLLHHSSFCEFYANFTKKSDICVILFGRLQSSDSLATSNSKWWIFLVPDWGLTFLLSSGMWHRVVWLKFTDVWEERSAFIWVEEDGDRMLQRNVGKSYQSTLHHFPEDSNLLSAYLLEAFHCT
jgi:hypothetical protein